MYSFFSDKEKLIFLCGVFEGEGNFGYYKHGKGTRQIELSVTMTDKDVVDKFLEYFNKGYICSPKPRKTYYKNLYKWKATGLEALKIINMMIPYLGKRRREKYYGMVQLIRDGGKDRSPYILQPSKDETGDVRCSS